MVRAMRYVVLVGVLLALAPHAFGQCLPATCSLTFTLQSDASGIALGGSGTSSASISFGTVHAFGGSVPSGVTQATNSTSFTLSTPFDVKVTCTNLANLLPCTLAMTTTYTLTAQLQSADSTDTWKVGGLTLSNASATTLTATGTYAQATAYTFALTIPYSRPSGAFSNTINFVAIAN